MKNVKCKIALFVASIAISISFTLAPPDCGGVERWKVKVLSDNAAKNVRYKNPKKSTIKKLIALKTPDVTGETPRLKLEKQACRITCTIDEVKKEDDKDYHLIIRDGNSVMIAEIVDPNCPEAQKSKHINAFKIAREAFDKYRKNGEYKKHRWRIVGVPYVDIKHGTPPEGCPENRIELHPVLKIEPID